MPPTTPGEPMSQPIEIQISLHLANVERGMRALDLWEAVAPAPERLASEVPFCHDTLEFRQWLQWIFIPRFRALLEGGHALPAQCGVAPIAEIAFADMDADTGELLEQLRAIDRLVTGRRTG